ncbi:hypothetical protein SERLA73DRAFT_183305 [Serpula lacrymans var. lacrymans S7.3]|uniref:Uncharacterized protein n=2 Tax=Serpula lacrymans var. lacrymans TaxID=341189 RepID=F8PZM8_SERL3|nr:uncharacterized protein SERLADRAFT_470389 [Serpula lacrymans var. lacrymans S7.9]EGN98350.1 hypothetical protein SERLA73DRAFT_183305 [Serpula lacrymans var. lacrymans S7.3]EGO23911.1 hypothetical protein SERLADRAFT_470389 [Serpula lacrymans var. lacrymans S7.9]
MFGSCSSAVRSSQRFRRFTPANLTQRTYASERTLRNRLPGVPQAKKDDDGDFRPPWVYSTSRILTYTLIPTAFLYCIFIADWGEREHVFMPPRRWLERQKAVFFSLSPDEAVLVQAKPPQPDSQSSIKEEAVPSSSPTS